MKANTMKQAIEIGFDFDAFENETTLEEMERAMIEFLRENIEILPIEEEECEVRTSGGSQNVSHGDYTCSGYIVDFSKHWFDEPETKVFHSSYLQIDEQGNAKNMKLYYLVGATVYNAPDGYWYNSKLKMHVKEDESISEE